MRGSSRGENPFQSTFEICSEALLHENAANSAGGRFAPALPAACAPHPPPRRAAPTQVGTVQVAVNKASEVWSARGGTRGEADSRFALRLPLFPGQRGTVCGLAPVQNQNSQPASVTPTHHHHHHTPPLLQDKAGTQPDTPRSLFITPPFASSPSSGSLCSFFVSFRLLFLTSSALVFCGIEQSTRREPTH